MDDYGLCVCLDIGVVFICLVFILCLYIVCLYNGVPQYINIYASSTHARHVSFSKLATAVNLPLSTSS